MEKTGILWRGEEEKEEEEETGGGGDTTLTMRGGGGPWEIFDDVGDNEDEEGER